MRFGNHIMNWWAGQCEVFKVIGKLVCVREAVYTHLCFYHQDFTALYSYVSFKIYE